MQPRILTPKLEPNRIRLKNNLDVDARYGVVEEGVYRGGYPTLHNFRFLRRLRLKTIISLVPEPATYDLAEFGREEGVQMIHIPAEMFKPRLSLNPPLALRLAGPSRDRPGAPLCPPTPGSLPPSVTAVSVLVDPANHPVYLHCLDGGNITGHVVMVLRKLMDWSPPSIYTEFQQYQPDNEIADEEKQLVGDQFTGVVFVPQTPPPWLWGGILKKSTKVPVKVKPPRPTPAPGGEGKITASPAMTIDSMMQQDPAKQSSPAGGPGVMCTCDRLHHSKLQILSDPAWYLRDRFWNSVWWLSLGAGASPLVESNGAPAHQGSPAA
eukprot:gene2981-3549_t